MKSRRYGSSRVGAKKPSIATWSWDAEDAAFSSPEIVRQRLNHSHPPVRVPTLASTPSATAISSFIAKRVGSSAL